ncbi:MAG: cell envelope biogenesis protein OmpA [candidate division NC10 bacterium]|nr:cell envelope biogenesis protein OmpA [candidate division NC10 bacterium]
MKRALAVLAAVLTLSACAASRPVLYSNAHLARVGQAQAEQDTAACRELADQYIASGGAGGTVAGSTAVGGGAGAAIGAAGGAVRGSPGTGAAVGAATGATAGFLRGLFKASEPSPVYKNFVNHCLRERGYEPVGWQ